MALIIAFAISIAILGVASLPAVYAQDDAPKAERTIMYYEDGCDPETTAGAASANLVEAMNAEFDNEQIRFIVITGGANQWQTNNILIMYVLCSFMRIYAELCDLFVYADE
jgi:hypothetical protein